MPGFAAFILLLVLLNGCFPRSDLKKDDVIQGKGIVADHGMVVSAHPQSSLIGTKILQAGGNAIDAAVATEFALSVCFPEAGNIGGGGFMVIRLNDGKTEVIDYREKAPLKATRDMYLDKSGNVSEGLSTETHLASGVPGTVDGMITAHSKYGVLTFKDVIQPAIDIAENGFPVTKQQASSFNAFSALFMERNSSKPAFVNNLGWNEGDTLVQKHLRE
jgi:gamma-glutamyltranspeptidase/glutathione hydrolase